MVLTRHSDDPAKGPFRKGPGEPVGAKGATAEGGARPQPRRQAKGLYVNVRLRTGLHRRLQDAAERRGLNFQLLISTWLDEDDARFPSLPGTEGWFGRKR